LPAAAALKPGDAKFVSGIRAHLAAGGFSNSSSDAQIAHLGDSLCNVAETSGPALAAQLAGAKSESEFSYSGKRLVALAERDICPQAVPKVIARFPGSGSPNTAQFVTGSTWTLTWFYNCSAMGTGNFIVSTETPGGGSDFNGASVNELGAEGHGRTYAYSDPGVHYFSVIAGGCTWKLTVLGTR
jgi:hypothetical protein